MKVVKYDTYWALAYTFRNELQYVNWNPFKDDADYKGRAIPTKAVTLFEYRSDALKFKKLVKFLDTIELVHTLHRELLDDGYDDEFLTNISGINTDA